jgi:hypothetical protein
MFRPGIHTTAADPVRYPDEPLRPLSATGPP